MTGNKGNGQRSPELTAFGATLDQLRANAKLSWPEVAELTHYSRTHVSNIVHGSKTPTKEFAEKCDGIFGTGELLQRLVPQHIPLDRVAVLKPVELPAAPSPFIDRDHLGTELDALLEENAVHRIAALYGEAGFGKTWQAVAWAHRVRHSFPDGVLFVDLHGDTAPHAHASPSSVLGNWLRALGVPDQQIPIGLEVRATLWRSLLGVRRMLLVLDDAASAAQVRPLLPGSGQSVALITSRSRLTDLSVHDTAIRQLHVPSFTQPESRSLLSSVLGAETVTTQATAADQLASQLRYHPLQLRLAAERVISDPTVTLQDLATDFAQGHARKRSPHAQDIVVEWNREPREDDVEKPSVSRVFDVYLGGGHNFAADRDFAAGAEKIIPEIREYARLNRAFLARAIQFCVAHGVEQIIDIGCGVPGPDATHHVARRVNPHSRVVYVDNEPVTTAFIRDALKSERDVGVVDADVRDVNVVLDAPTTSELIDFQRPVVLVMGFLLHFVPDEDDPAGALARYRARMAPGSYLIISHDTGDGREQDMRRLAEYYTDANRPVILRTHKEMTYLVDGFELVKPGIVHMPLWRPDPADPPYTHPERTCAYALVARTAG